MLGFVSFNSLFDGLVRSSPDRSSTQLPLRILQLDGNHAQFVIADVVR
jgi:hypothetical protein